MTEQSVQEGDSASLEQYRDLSKLDQDAYECQRCGSVLQEEFDRGECPICDTPDSLIASGEWARSLTPINFNPPGAPAYTRTVRL